MHTLGLRARRPRFDIRPRPADGSTAVRPSSADRPSRRTAAVSLITLALTGLLAAIPEGQAQTANWKGGDFGKRWNDPLNWDPQVVPTNSPGKNYSVYVPADSSISYFPGLNASIKALAFYDSSLLDISEASQLRVVGLARIEGTIQTKDPGSAFFAPDAGLTGHARLLAYDGSHIVAGGGAYTWAGDTDVDTDLIAADNGSVIDLRTQLHPSSLALALDNVCTRCVRPKQASLTCVVWA